jgi:hypothetical protein
MSDHDAVKSGVENVFSHSAMLAQEAIAIIRNSYDRPSAVYRPSLTLDGDQWIALYGDNLQSGCVGCGDTPDSAMWAFDKAWHTKGTK